jgi:oligosaccharide repeat unit polymerase
MFIISVFTAILNINVWKFTIAPVTVVIILTSLIAFGSGEFLVNIMYYKRKQRIRSSVITSNGSLKKWCNKAIDNSTIAVLCLCVILGLLMIHYYNETVRIAMIAGYKKGPFMLQYAREALFLLTEPRDRIANFSIIIAEANGYIFSFIFLYNYIFFPKFKRNVVNILPIIIYCLYAILTTGRGDFITLIALWIIIGGTFFMQKNKWHQRYNARIIIYGVLGIVLFLSIFIFAGSFKNATIMENALSTISFYTGLSIPSLNDFIIHPRPQNTYFGQHTLFGVYGILRRIGFDYPQFYVPSEMVSFNGTRGNVYTAIRRYLQDYGYFGLYGIMFSLGFLYSIIFLSVNKRRNFLLILYAAIFSPIVEIAIEDTFFMNLISVSTIYLVLSMGVSYFSFVNKKYLYIILKNTN